MFAASSKKRRQVVHRTLRTPRWSSKSRSNFQLSTPVCNTTLVNNHAAISSLLLQNSLDFLPRWISRQHGSAFRNALYTKMDTRKGFSCITYAIQEKMASNPCISPKTQVDGGSLNVDVVVTLQCHLCIIFWYSSHSEQRRTL